MKLIWTFIIFMLTNNCEANDSIGYLGAGGIEFKKTQDISMEKEILTISRTLIRVEYEFLNTTSKPIKETIVFPMPSYAFDEGCSPHHSGQLGGFKVWVNGSIQATLRTVRARLNEKDVTNRLKELGFTDEDIAEYRGVDGGCGIDEHPPQGIFAKNKDVLVRDGMMNYSVENEHAEFPTYHSTPLWKAAFFYSWEQVFPPKTIVRVAHEYVPFTGSTSGLYHFEDVSKFGSGYLDKDFCISDGTKRKAKKIQDRLTTGALKIPVGGFVWQSVNYVLTTGANWAGPIKDFTLNLRKESEDEVVSLCFDEGEFKKNGKLILLSHIKNFMPKSDISAIFFYPPDPMAGYSGGGYMPGYRRHRN